jgi:hypothetical protein
LVIYKRYLCFLETLTMFKLISLHSVYSDEQNWCLISIHGWNWISTNQRAVFFLKQFSSLKSYEQIVFYSFIINIIYRDSQDLKCCGQRTLVSNLQNLFFWTIRYRWNPNTAKWWLINFWGFFIFVNFRLLSLLSLNIHSEKISIFESHWNLLGDVRS